MLRLVAMRGGQVFGRVHGYDDNNGGYIALLYVGSVILERDAHTFVYAQNMYKLNGNLCCMHCCEKIILLY